VEESKNLSLVGEAIDIDPGDRLDFIWYDNNREIARGESVFVKLRPGEHNITLQVSDGKSIGNVSINIKVNETEEDRIRISEPGFLIPILLIIIFFIIISVLIYFKIKTRVHPKEQDILPTDKEVKEEPSLQYDEDREGEEE
jgi:hypothetical protein